MPEVISLLSDSESESRPPPRARARQRSRPTSPTRNTSSRSVAVDHDDFFKWDEAIIPQSSFAAPLRTTTEEPARKRRRLSPLEPSSPLSPILPPAPESRASSLSPPRKQRGQELKEVDWGKSSVQVSGWKTSNGPDSQFSNFSYDDLGLLDSDEIIPSSVPLAKEKGKGKEKEVVPAEGPAKKRDPIVIDEIDDIDFFDDMPGPSRRRELPKPTVAAWDPISSSAPPSTFHSRPGSPSRGPSKVRSVVITIDDDSDDCQASKNSRPIDVDDIDDVDIDDDGDDDNSDDDFPDLIDLASRPLPIFASSTKPDSYSCSSSSKPLSQSKPKSKSGSEPKKTAQERAREREEKAREREERTKEREAKRKHKLQEKERAKEQKAREKALAEANKMRTDKKLSTPEMIVDLPLSLDEAVRVQAETLLRDLGVFCTTWNSPVENVVRWRRKVKANYNEELGLWEPVPERIEKEGFAMVIMTAQRYVDIVLGDSDDPTVFDSTGIDAHVTRMRSAFPGDTLIYMIEGLNLWLRKNRTARNRQFVSAIRSGLDNNLDNNPSEPPPSTQSRRRKQNPSPQSYIDENVISYSLLHLQIHHSPNLQIHHTTLPLDTARWIAIFTQHISTVPYRRQRDAYLDSAASFCMDSGQVRTADSPREIYVRMLQEIGRVTAPIAYGIAEEYPSVRKLVKGLEEKGPLALEKVRRCVDRMGGRGDRVVGPAVSRRMWKIFLGRDETSMDI